MTARPASGAAPAAPTIGPAESRARRPDLWSAYDRASEMAFALAEARTLVAEIAEICVAVRPDHLVELLDMLRARLRLEIEADAAGGKDFDAPGGASEVAQ